MFLRGRDSGYLEQTSGRESFEALYVYIRSDYCIKFSSYNCFVSHANSDGLESAKKLCENLVDHVSVQVYRYFMNAHYVKVKLDYEAFIQSKIQYQQHTAVHPHMYRHPPPPPQGNYYSTSLYYTKWYIVEFNLCITIITIIINMSACVC